MVPVREGHVEVALVSERLDCICVQRITRLPGHRRQPVLVAAGVRRLVRHNQMMFRIEGTLHVVANGVGAVALRCHRVRIGISERDLGFTRRDKLRLECRQALDERLERLNAPRRLGDFGSRYLHASRSIKFREIAGDALVDRCEPPLKPLVPEVLFAVVHGLELAAVSREAGVVTQVQVPAKRDKPRHTLRIAGPLPAAEIGDGFEIGPYLPHQPNQLDIAQAFALQPARRLNLVEITVNVDLELRRQMIAGRLVASGMTSKPSSSKSVGTYI
jgi:hypothetical protein